MPPPSTLRERLVSEESGFGILEVMVSALLVAILAVGVLSGFDAANATSGNSRARAIAADVAQQDQERMRAFRAKELSNLNQSYSRTVASVAYQVTSTAVWVNDGSGSRRCGLTSGRADYLKISSTVTWPNMRGADPVTETSLYAPPSGSFGDEGNLGVEVLDRNALGVPGVSVSAAGPANRNGTTDGQGCIFFAFLPQGDYTVTINKSGYVDPNGNNTVTSVFGVQGGTTQVQPVDYDQAGTVPVNVLSKRGSGTPDLVAQANYLSFGHSRLASPNVRLFGNGTPASAFTAGSLFPFDSTYAVYSGSCSGAQPVSPPTALVPAGGVSPAVTVREIAVRVKWYGSFVGTGTVVKLYPKGTGCTGNIGLVTERRVSTDSATEGWIVAPSGALPRDPGVPYGLYDVCVQALGYRMLLPNRTLADPNGVEIDFGSTAVQGNCP